MINKMLLDLHKEPIDIYEEQNKLKNQLACNREADIKSRIFAQEHESLQSLITKQNESFESTIETYRDLIKKRHEAIAGFKVTLSGYLQKKEYYQATLPPSHEIMQLFDKRIISTQRLIEELSEDTFELKQQLLLLEAHALRPIEISDAHLSINDVYSNTYNGIDQLREAATVFSQAAAHKEQYNLELKQRVENYAQMVQILKDDPAQVAHDALAQNFEDIVKNHAEISEEYLGVFEAIATPLPKMLRDFANAIQNNTDDMIDITQTMDAVKALNAQTRDRRIIEDLHNGTLGKYMEGDLPFINYLNSRGVLAAVDVEYASKEVEAGKVKDRGITELIDLLREHNIDMVYKDVFLLRLLLIEHHKVVEVSTKNNKLDYTKNYLNQHKSLTDKAIAIGTTVSPPLRNPSELKILILDTLAQQHSIDDSYARDAMMELLNNHISRLPKKFPTK